MLHIIDTIKVVAIRILQKYCNGGYGGPTLSRSQINTIADALSVELLPAILAMVQKAIADAAHHMLPTTIAVDPKTLEMIEKISKS